MTKIIPQRYAALSAHNVPSAGVTDAFTTMMAGFKDSEPGVCSAVADEPDPAYATHILLASLGEVSGVVEGITITYMVSLPL
jgi:hypothetical protein